MSLLNAGASDVTVDSIQANLPSSPAAVTYTSGSSKLNGNSIADPYESESLVTWYRLFTVPANSSIDLTFDVVFPNVAGTDPTTTLSATGSVHIDSTSAAGDSAPVTTNVYIGVTPTATRTSTPTYTATAIAATATPTQTSTPTYTATAIVGTATSTPTATPTHINSSTPTASATPTAQPSPSATGTATPKPTSTPSRCPRERSLERREILRAPQYQML